MFVPYLCISVLNYLMFMHRVYQIKRQLISCEQIPVLLSNEDFKEI